MVTHVLDCIYKQLKQGWIQRGEGGPDPPPLKNHKNIGFLSNTGQDPLKNHKATEPVFNDVSSSAVSETPFTWRFAGGRMIAQFSDIWILYPLINLKKKKKKKKKHVIEFRPPLTKLSGSAHVKEKR